MLYVVKRDGREVVFNKDKISNAIRKASKEVSKELDHNEIINITENVYKSILKTEKSSITVEEIQNLIEEELKNKKYDDVYESTKNYRERRNQSRLLFVEEKKMHKFLKTLESLGLKSAHEEDAKRENANVDGDTAMGTMLQYGSTVSKEFAKSYLMKKKFADAHDSGDIHIHDLDFMPMGTTTCLQIDLNKLFKNGFSTGHGFIREPNDIMSYSALAAIAIQANQNDQHGGQAIPAFDYYLAPGVLKTYKKQLKQTMYDLLDYSGFLTFINFDKFVEKINKLNSVEFDESDFDKLCKNSDEVKRIVKISKEKALQKTDRITYQAMEAFIHNLNTMHSRAGAQVPFSSINFGTDTSAEGRMIIKNYLLALDAGLGHNETPIFPISIFKVKEGVNYNQEDKNYDLFKLACEVSAKRLFPNFSFIDSPFNLEYYKEGDYNTEVGYMGCRTRVLANVADKDKCVTAGRGNLSFTSINLPRLGIKHGIATKERKVADMEGFYKDLDELLELVKDQLLERFEIQCNKRVYNFPFLIGEGLWLDSEKLKPTDKLRRVLKHGTLTVGFIGLAECLKALIGKHHGESEEAQKLGLEIIGHMKDKMDEYALKYNLNFGVIATPAEGLSGRFTRIDKAIYGNLKGITDREYYTNSFHVPVYYNISAAKKIHLEAPYHALTLAGHITYIELDGDTASNVKAFEKAYPMLMTKDIG